MKYVIIEPASSWTQSELSEKIQKISLKLRLDISIASTSELNEAITDISAHAEKQGLDTIIAVGSLGWFDQVVSTALRTFSQAEKQIPVFAHLATPRSFPGANRLPAYLESRLQQGLSAIAARKISEQPVYVCGDAIWFLHSLDLQIDNTAPNHSRFTITTPGSGTLKLQANPEKLHISTEHTILDQDNHHLTVLAQQRQLTQQPQHVDAGFLQAVKKKVDTYLYEDVFHVPASSLTIESTQGYQAPEYNLRLPVKTTIRAADFKVRCIVPKNDISKY
jgi:hypothetical protein